MMIYMICYCESFTKDKAEFFNYSLCICVCGFEETTGNSVKTTYSFQYETDVYAGSKNYYCSCLLEL
jgi:hypothetical protein